MTRFSKIYQLYGHKKLDTTKSENSHITKRAGYGYIKRRVGLLSNEVDGPIYWIIKKW